MSRKNLIISTCTVRSIYTSSTLSVSLKLRNEVIAFRESSGDTFFASFLIFSVFHRWKNLPYTIAVNQSIWKSSVKKQLSLL